MEKKKNPNKALWTFGDIPYKAQKNIYRNCIPVQAFHVLYGYVNKITLRVKQ